MSFVTELARNATTFLPGMPLIKYSGDEEDLDIAELKKALENQNPRVIIIENPTLAAEQRFSLFVGNRFRDKISFEKVIKNHEGVTFTSAYFVYVSETAMLSHVGKELIGVSNMY